ncbi:MAG TPA: sigma-70 family RNA polymerase sigma factor [Myxococcales bacterium]
MRLARAAWPQICVGTEDFVRYAAERLSPADRPSLEGNAGDLYLACACCLGDRVAVDSILALIAAEVPRWVRRIDSSSAFADDIVQELRVHLLVGIDGGRPAIADYRGTGPIKGWLRAVAIHRALRLHSRNGRDDSRRPDGSQEPISRLSPEVELIQARYRPEFERCLLEELAAMPLRARTLLRLHHFEQVTIEKLGAIYHVSRATAARRLREERDRLLRGTRRRLRESLLVSSLDLDGLVPLVVGSIQVSLERILRSADTAVQ